MLLEFPKENLIHARHRKVPILHESTPHKLYFVLTNFNQTMQRATPCALMLNIVTEYGNIKYLHRIAVTFWLPNQIEFELDAFK